MKETKFLLYGQHIRPYTIEMIVCLILQQLLKMQLLPVINLILNFVIKSIEVDDSEVEVVKLQSLT
jgi:hypothetical protein